MKINLLERKVGLWYGVTAKLLVVNSKKCCNVYFEKDSTDSDLLYGLKLG